MSTIHSETVGHPPAVLIGKPDGTVESNAPKNPEKDKYQKLWGDIQGYRNYSPGEQDAQIFIEQVRPKAGDSVIDFGCGTGRGSLKLTILGQALLGGPLKVTMVDFTDNSLDPDIKNMLTTQADYMKFVQADLERPLPVAAKYGFCTDVMEHIPPEKVDDVLDNILKSAQHVFFGISTVPDHFGQSIGETLHLTVKPYEWWLKKFRDRECVIHWSQGWEHGVYFYVSAWTTAAELVKIGKVNTADEQLLNNIRENVKRDVKVCVPHNTQEDISVMILAGGPSLENHWDEIIARRKEGQPLVTVNGTYNQCLERGIEPSAQIIVDAREFNKRFVTPHCARTKYLLASQCHPSTFDAAPKDQTFIWHACAGGNDPVAKILDEHYGSKNLGWFPVPGGSTAVLRAFPLLRMLGFKKFEVFGFDSCLMDKDGHFIHHAYEQKENDSNQIVKVTCGDRIFYCHPWMASQAEEYMDQVKMMGDQVEMIVYGDGLISYILKTGAELARQEEFSLS